MDGFISIILFFFDMFEGVSIDGTTLLTILFVIILGGNLVGIIVDRLIG